MASTWITKRGQRYRVMFRVGGRESMPRYAGSFATKREALLRKGWVAGELAAMRVPNFSGLAEPETAPTLRERARAWQASRKDVRDSTRVQHQTALGRVLPILGSRPIDSISVDDVQAMVDSLTAEGKARESIRKSKAALAMVLDFAGIEPNPARSNKVKLPLEEPDEVEPPSATHVEAAAWLLTPAYLLGVLTLDATGARIGELEAARIGDLDESRKAWLVRAKVAKTRRARWVRLLMMCSTLLLSGYLRERIETPRRRSSRSATLTAFGWLSGEHAVMLRFPPGRPMTSGTVASVCFTTKARHGRRSVPMWANAIFR